MIGGCTQVHFVTHDALQAYSVAKRQLPQNVDVWETPVRVPVSRHRTRQLAPPQETIFLLVGAVKSELGLTFSEVLRPGVHCSLG